MLYTRLRYLVCHMRNGVTDPIMRHIPRYITHQRLDHECFMRHMSMLQNGLQVD